MKRTLIILGLAIFVIAGSSQFWVLYDDYITPRLNVDIKVPTGQELILSTGAYDDLRFPISALKVSPVSNKPDFDSANVCYVFDKAAVELVLGVAQMPHGWKEGTDLSPHLHWSPATDDSGDVVWRLEYKIAEINGEFQSSWYSDTVTFVSDSSDLKHQMDDFTEIDMASYGGVSLMILWRVARLGNHPLDTYDNDARLYEFDIHFQKDRLGSITEYSR